MPKEALRIERGRGERGEEIASVHSVKLNRQMAWLFSTRDLGASQARIEAALARIEAKLNGVTTHMAQLDSLTAEVTRNTSVVGSALTLIQGLAAQIQAAGTDPAALATIVASLKANDDQIAAAIAANTPAAPSSSTPPSSTPPSSSSTAA